jgi:hypothetical protein
LNYGLDFIFLAFWPLGVNLRAVGWGSRPPNHDGLAGTPQKHISSVAAHFYLGGTSWDALTKMKGNVLQAKRQTNTEKKKRYSYTKLQKAS